MGSMQPLRRPTRTTLNPQRTRSAAWLCSLALLLSSGFCLATPCSTQTEEAEVVPPREELGPDFQPSKYDTTDMTVLRRIRYTPPGYDPDSSTKYPTVISIPPTVFRQGEAAGAQSQRLVSKALAAEGFLVFQVEHRLAPPGQLDGQDDHTMTTEGMLSGRPPQQTNDVKQQILAALADMKCNQKIYLVGGSSGGCHALFCALDPTPTVPTWSGSKVSKIKAVVSFSGPTNLSSREGSPQVLVDNFEQSVE
ncbi:MAG: hypothetical protein M3Q46_13005, partial [Verrucomicrobiota bacterium]|nr:hypothetical protein [Verrucomicrobiota bacterium]